MIVRPEFEISLFQAYSMILHINMRISQILISTLCLTGRVLGEDYHGEDAEDEMAGIAFMWPPDRAWSKSNDNTAPCGSSQGIVNRTDFPLGEYSKVHLY